MIRARFLVGWMLSFSLLVPAPSSAAPPVNDDCTAAPVIVDGVVSGDTSGATLDGTSSCTVVGPQLDVWYRYVVPPDGNVAAYVEEPHPGAALAIHASCPGTTLNELACGSEVDVEVSAGTEVLIRAASFGSSHGPFTFGVGPFGSISGRVTSADTGTPLAGIRIDIRDSDFRIAGSVATDEDGEYSVDIARPGTYFASTAAEDDYQDEAFDDFPCLELFFECPLGTPIQVDAGQEAADIDFALEPLGAISGRVIDLTTGEGLADVPIRVASEQTHDADTAWTDEDGRYRVEGLYDGIHYAAAFDNEYLIQVYNGLPCLEPFAGTSCDISSGTPIDVDLGHTTEGIDFALEALGGITGRVIDAATGLPLPFVRVEASRIPNIADIGETDDSGNYRIGGLDPGIYSANTSGAGNYLHEIYDDLPCGLFCDLTFGTPIPVALGTFTQVDFALDLGGSITGTITEAFTGDKITSADIYVYRADGAFVDFYFSDADGRFSVSGLATDNYHVFVRSSAHLDELYQNIPFQGSQDEFDPTLGTPIFVEAGSTVSGIDFELDRLGAISGTVIDEATGEGLSGSVEVWSPQDESVGSGGLTDGEFLVSHLASGIYHVTVVADTHHDELYDDIPCPSTGLDCDPTRGALVAVALNAVTEGIDFELDRLGAISGTVVAGVTGQPLDRVRVEIWDSNGFVVKSGRTDETGTYLIPGLPTGSYYVVAQGRSGYIDQLYDDEPCPGECDLSTGSLVAVTDGAVTSNIDFELSRSGSVSGTVRERLSGGPISSISVRLWDAAGTIIATAITAGDGTYSFERLAPGTYFVSTRNSPGFLGQLHDGLPCPFSNCDPLGGTPIVVDLDVTVTGVDFDLDLEQGIRGRLSHDPSGAPLGFIEVNFWDSSSGYFDSVQTSDNGGYAVALPLGTYLVFTNASFAGFGVVDEVYDDVPCLEPLDCDLTDATPIEVTAGATIQGIDFALAGDLCQPGFFDLCLTDDRFRVSVDWRSHEGGGLGRAVQLTDDSGYFWFFDSDNVEAVVKVLDACGLDPFNNFWVFATGLTDVEVGITVQDTLTGESRIYANPIGAPFELIRDTSAFATCPLPLGAGDPTTEPERVRAELGTYLELLATGSIPASGMPTLTTASSGSGSCEPTATRLCFGDGRFELETTWRTSDGESGPGLAQLLTNDTGYFWFFNPDNVEVVVKVLDACELDPFNNFWVFAAGLTDVEVRLTVTDTVTGESQEYFNPLGVPFRPVQDTDAFSPCP